MNNENLIDTAEVLEKVVLIGVDNDRLNSVMSVEDSLIELAELAKTAGCVVMGSLMQKRESIHPKHYIGKGKVEELKDLVSLHQADTVVCDDEITSTQMKNLGEMLGVKVIDRTMVILDIFAQRAISSEGKIQVELAQQKYNLSHLIGLGKSMSRQGGGASGGVGARRGGGEKKLELDKRVINERIAYLSEELKIIKQQRSVSREKRLKNKIPVISLIGYTNAGKSTIMNHLTDAGVLTENKLFATLDTTTRKYNLSNGEEVLLTDTVGFIQKLPHNLVDAFKATLEELLYADILLHAVDASNAMREQHIKVVYATLLQLKVENKPIITVLNKIDAGVEYPLPSDDMAEHVVPISAKTGENVDNMIKAIEETLKSRRQNIFVLIPYSEGKLTSLVHETCEIVTEEHRETGTYMELYAESEIAKRLEGFEIE